MLFDTSDDLQYYHCRPDLLAGEIRVGIKGLRGGATFHNFQPARGLASHRRRLGIHTVRDDIIILWLRLRLVDHGLGKM